MPLGMEVGLGPGDFVLDGGAATPGKKDIPRHIQFSANVYCGQTARWIKMPLGTEVNVGPSDVVFDGVADSPKRGTAPSFPFMCIVAKGLNG